MGDVTRQDIESFIDVLAARKIVTEQTFAKEIIEKEITASMTFFSEKSAERQIPSMEIAVALFKIGWLDDRVKLANIPAAVT